MKHEAVYICDSCGREITILIDPSAGSIQKYVEDCLECCKPNIIHVEIGLDGVVQVWAEADQDQL